MISESTQIIIAISLLSGIAHLGAYYWIKGMTAKKAGISRYK